MKASPTAPQRVNRAELIEEKENYEKVNGKKKIMFTATTHRAAQIQLTSAVKR